MMVYSVLFQDNITREHVKRESVSPPAGSEVKYAHEDLRSNASFMLEALAVYDQALFYAAPKLRRDRAFVLQACHVTGRAMARPTSLATLGERRRGTVGQRPSESVRRLEDHSVLLHCGGSLPEF